ncbi:MAG: DUF5103 domain-containing protein [Bacteroidota bacterium]|nr:DUF5103 domain-containing protein [Bacteroidota bacterium]
MKKFLMLSLVMLMFFQVLTLHAQVYRTGCHTDQIHTLIIHPLNDWKAAPVLQIGSDNQLLISFDEMSHDYKRYAYRIIHCNKDWTRSDLNELEYMDGFPENDIEQYEQSSNTYTMYTHYSITLPNDKVQLKCSGNYALEVFDKEGSGEALLTACFSLFEHKTIVNASLTASTDIDFEQSHQQLYIEVSPIGWTFQQPESEIKLTIRQNCRQDNEINQIEPLSISSNKLVYAHCHELIIDGGNEYRRFEITTYKHPGLGVNKIAYFKPFFNVELFENEKRLNGYVYDQDQNGRYLVRNTDYNSDDTESDYFLVHFSFPMETPFLNGALYLNGDLVENRLNANSRMDYNAERKAYEKTLFLKQGSYNYQYLFKADAGEKPSTRRTEGSYWQTENDYHIFVYYRPIGGRYDQLIGYDNLNSTF